MAASVDLEVFETRRRGDAADRAATAGDRLVIAVGGDGTAHEVVNGLLRCPGNGSPRFGALLRAGTAGDHAEPPPAILHDQDRLRVGLRLNLVALLEPPEEDARESLLPLLERKLEVDDRYLAIG